jgi:hypothetical protein
MKRVCNLILGYCRVTFKLRDPDGPQAPAGVIVKENFWIILAQ